MIKAAIFDMDGTLTDTERLYRETWLEMAEKYEQEPSIDFTKAVCGSNGQEMMDIIHRFYPDIDSKQFMDDTIAMVVFKMEKDLPLKEGAKEIVEYLKKKGLKLGVASSSSHAQIEKNMKKCGLHDYFDVYVGGNEVNNSKPHPEIFQVSAGKMGVNPEECYVFEDGMNGLRSGLAAGCQVYMIVDLTPPDDVVAPQCAGIYDSFLDVMEVL
ncbi:MAG: HAD family phosphatase [Eubacteriales bacterium]|nr:HAD family phosphatase [Eubacteriales bacterium]